MDTIQIKCYLNFDIKQSYKSNEIRRFDLFLNESNTVSYAQLMDKIQASFKDLLVQGEEIRTYWLDDENELVGFVNDAELEYSIEFHKKLWTKTKCHNPLIKIYILQINENPNLNVEYNQATDLGMPNETHPNSSASYWYTDFSKPVYPHESKKSTKIKPNVEVIGEYAKRVLSPIGRDIHKIYNQNFSKYYPGYKMSQLSKSSHSNTPETIHKEAAEKTDISETIIENAVQKPDDIVTDNTNKYADTLEKLKAMGLSDNENGWLTKLVESKDGDLNLIVDTLFPKSSNSSK